jgi:hypothetical protein
MATDLAKEIAKTEKQTQEMADLTIEHNTKIEKMQRSMVNEKHLIYFKIQYLRMYSNKRSFECRMK